MRMGRPILELVLKTEELETLQRWAGRPKSAQALAQRARLVLACAQGKSNTAVSREMDLTLQTIGKWRSRFVVHRLEGLLGEARPGAPRRLGDADVERVLTLTLEATPRDATHWSPRSLARRCGMSQRAASRLRGPLRRHPHH